MAKVVDITSKITNDLPIVKITDDIVVTINNRKSNVLNVMAMANEKHLFLYTLRKVCKNKKRMDIQIRVMLRLSQEAGMNRFGTRT